MITLEDIRLLYQKKKTALLIAVFLGAAVGFFSIFSSPLQFKIEASFKEKPEQGSAESSIRDLFLNGLKAAQQPEAISLMKSNQVLKAVVSSYGLQAEIKRGFLEPLRRFRDHLYAELRWKIPERDWFSFRKVEYSGEESLELNLRFINYGVFEVLDGQKKIGVGEVGTPFSMEQASFVVESVPKTLLFWKNYRLKLSPWMAKTHQLRKKLKIGPQKTSKSIYDLTLFFEERQKGKKVLDGIMEEYRTFLKRDHDQIAFEQIAYLEKKQGELYEKMTQVFDEHAAVLKEAMGTEGFFNLEQEVKSYSEMHAKVLEIDLELQKLESSFANEGGLARRIGELNEEKSLLQMANPGFLCSNEWPKETARVFDLEASRTLYADYAHKLEASRKQIEILSHVGNEDLNALSDLLKDPLSQEVIANAAALTLKLQDQKYSSQKERSRWSEDLALQNKILQEHVEELLKVEAMNASIFREKMGELKRESLANLDQQISVLKRHSQDEIEEKKKSLLAEKERLKKKLERSKHLPERWKRENWLQMKTDLSKEVMTILTELVESKTMGHQLFHIESKPLDFSTAARLPQNTHLLMLTLLCGLGCGVLYFFAQTLVSIASGLPLTASALKAMKLPFSGTIEEPDTLAQISLFLDQKVALLLGGAGPDYAHSFASHLAKEEKKVLLIDCAPKRTQKSSIEPLDNYFFVSSKENFLPKFLEASKDFYDAILLWYPGNFNSAAAQSLLRISEKAVVTITQEQREELTPLLHWAYHDGNCRITFICSPHER